MHDIPDIYVENIQPIANQPSLIITIGVPGSGKSTWAKIRCLPCNVCAADDYFDIFHNGTFMPSELKSAHEWCHEQIYSRLIAGKTCVANNTNTNLWEMNAYVRFVIMSQLPFKIVFAVMIERNIKVLRKRGVHGVPAKNIKQMCKRLDYWLKRGPPTIRSVLKKCLFFTFFNAGF